MTTINAIVEPSFGMPVIASPCAGTWRTAAATTAPTTALLDGSHRADALNQGVAGFAAKRRTVKGSPAWRAPDC